VVRNDLVLSVRTEADGENAAKLVQQALEGLGRGGGHLHRGGGKILNVGNGPSIGRDLQEELRNRWLAVCGANRRMRAHLIGRHEIAENL
jgi:hypothetical protein